MTPSTFVILYTFNIKKVGKAKKTRVWRQVKLVIYRRGNAKGSHPPVLRYCKNPPPPYRALSLSWDTIQMLPLCNHHYIFWLTDFKCNAFHHHATYNSIRWVLGSGGIRPLWPFSSLCNFWPLLLTVGQKIWKSPGQKNLFKLNKSISQKKNIFCH